MDAVPIPDVRQLLSQNAEQIASMDPTHWAIFAGGLLLFLSARTIAHRALTFYVSGATFGVLLSVLFLAMFIRRFLPKRIFMIPVELIGGPAISYLYYYGYKHAQEILMQNWKWLALYAAVAATISLVICYVSDVSSNVRIRNVLQWTLQSVSVVLMYYASQSSLLCASTLLFVFAVKQGLPKYVRRFIYWLFEKPPTREYLTKEEYEQEGAEYTKKELAKLRAMLLDDCRLSTPNTSLCNRSKNKEQLASFLVTNNDVSVQSMLDHRKQFGPRWSNTTDDEEDDDESLLDDDSDHGEDNLILTDDD